MQDKQGMKILLALMPGEQPGLRTTAVIDGEVVFINTTPSNTIVEEDFVQHAQWAAEKLLELNLARPGAEPDHSLLNGVFVDSDGKEVKCKELVEGRDLWAFTKTFAEAFAPGQTELALKT